MLSHADTGRETADVIAGKGEGSIFLLHGPPGVGKTLTAEAIAELLHKPLYTVSMGELGTNPESLESNLQDILVRATPSAPRHHVITSSRYHVQRPHVITTQCRSLCCAESGRALPFAKALSSPAH